MAKAKNNRNSWVVWLIALALVLGTVACYLPVRHFDYVSIDDPLYVSQKPIVQRGLTWEGVAWAFKNVEGGNWNPLVCLSHMADCQIYGIEAGGHHVTNVALHTVNVVLLFLILRGMTGTTWRSGLVAAIFAWHPVHVESVAWVSERKDVLSTLFWLLTMLAYARSTNAQCPKPKVYYGLSLLFFALGLMSKPMLVTLPVVLLVMDWWPLKRIYGVKQVKVDAKNRKLKSGKQEQMLQVSFGRALLEKAPFLAMSAGVSVVSMMAQQHAKAMGDQGWFLRLENAAVSCVAYVGQFFWLAKLAVFYPFPDSVPLWRAGFAAMVVLVITLGVIWRRSQQPYLAAGWLWFLVTLLPVIGLVQVGMQSRADRYTYVPYIGLGMMVSWGLAELAEKWPRMRAAAVLAACAGVGACVAVTCVQVRYWQNTKTLNEHAVEVIPGNYVAYSNLGDELLDEGKLEEAEKDFKEVIRLKPRVGKPYNNLGKTYALRGQLEDAELNFNKAIQLEPDMAQAHWNLGHALLRRGKDEEGLAEMKRALQLNPDDIQGRVEIMDALLSQGKGAEALPYCEAVLKARPDDAHGHFALGQSRLVLKQPEHAVGEFKESLRLAPESPAALNALAWIYATNPKEELRNGAEAVRLAERGCAATKRQNAAVLDTLAAAYAEVNRFEDAIKVANEARAVALAVHDTDLAKQLEQRLEAYKAGNPYREEP